MLAFKQQYVIESRYIAQGESAKFVSHVATDLPKDRLIEIAKALKETFPEKEYRIIKRVIVETVEVDQI